MKYYYGPELIRIYEDGYTEIYHPAIKEEGNKAEWKMAYYSLADEVEDYRKGEWDELETEDLIQRMIQHEDDRWWNWSPKRSSEELEKWAREREAELERRRQPNGPLPNVFPLDPSAIYFSSVGEHDGRVGRDKQDGSKYQTYLPKEDTWHDSAAPGYDPTSQEVPIHYRDTNVERVDDLQQVESDILKLYREDFPTKPLDPNIDFTEYAGEKDAFLIRDQLPHQTTIEDSYGHTWQPHHERLHTSWTRFDIEFEPYQKANDLPEDLRPYRILALPTPDGYITLGKPLTLLDFKKPQAKRQN